MLQTFQAEYGMEFGMEYEAGQYRSHPSEDGAILVSHQLLLLLLLLLLFLLLLYIPSAPQPQSQVKLILPSPPGFNVEFPVCLESRKKEKRSFPILSRLFIYRCRAALPHNKGLYFNDIEMLALAPKKVFVSYSHNLSSQI